MKNCKHNNWRYVGKRFIYLARKLPNPFPLTPVFWKNCKHNWLLWVKGLYILPENSPTHFHWPQSTSSSWRKIAKVTYEAVSFMFPLAADDGVTRFFSSLPSSFAPQLHQIWSEESDSDLLICYHQSNTTILHNWVETYLKSYQDF